MAKTEQEHRTKTTKETRMLRVALTQEELLTAGDKLAELLDNHRQAVSARESLTKQYKAKESELDAQIESQQILVRNKSELRKVICQSVMDYTDVRAYTTRLDTGEIIEDRKLTEDERQSSLPFDGQDQEHGDA